MKYCSLLILFLSSCLVASGALDKDQERRLGDLEIAGIRETDMKDDDRNKYEVVEVNTFQDEEDDSGPFRIRVVVELTDKGKKTYLVDYYGKRPGSLDSEYTGEDYWFLYMPHGELERLKISAYVVQYGFMDEDEDEFRVFAEECDDVDTLDELLARTTTLLPGTIRMKHYYMYEDEEEGEIESDLSDVRKIKK